MAEIVLQFAAEGGIGSRVIQWFDHGFWATHVDTVLPGRMLLGARWHGGVQVRAPEYARFTRTEVLRLPTTDAILDDYMWFIRSQIGKPYDSCAIAAFAAGRNWRATNAWFCDELVLAGLERRFLPHQLPGGVSRYTPSDCWLICSMFAQQEKVHG